MRAFSARAADLSFAEADERAEEAAELGDGGMSPPVSASECRSVSDSVCKAGGACASVEDISSLGEAALPEERTGAGE